MNAFWRSRRQMGEYLILKKLNTLEGESYQGKRHRLKVTFGGLTRHALFAIMNSSRLGCAVSSETKRGFLPGQVGFQKSARKTLGTSDCD
jgi:hypothetical protein